MYTTLPMRDVRWQDSTSTLNANFASPAEAPGGGAPRENATVGADRLIVGVDFGTTYSG